MSNGGEGNYDLYLRELDGAHQPDHDPQGKGRPRALVAGAGSHRVHFGPQPARATCTSSTSPKKTTTRAHARRVALPLSAVVAGRQAPGRDSRQQREPRRLCARAGPQPAAVPPQAAQHLAATTICAQYGRRTASASPSTRTTTPAGDPKSWAIAVVAADGSDPTEGDGTRRARRRHRGDARRRARAGMAARQPAHRLRARRKTGVLPHLHRRRRQPHKHARCAPGPR